MYDCNCAKRGVVSMFCCLVLRRTCVGTSFSETSEGLDLSIRFLVLSGVGLS